MFYNVPLYLNPALTGSHDCGLRIGSTYRDQWRSVSNPYKTFTLFADANVSPEKIKTNAFGVGLAFMRDQAGEGDLSTNDLRLFLAYHKSLMKKDKVRVSLGLSMALVNHAIHPEQLTFETQWTGSVFNTNLPSFETFVTTSVYYYDMSAGIVITYSPSQSISAGLGGSLSHITRPRYDFFGGQNKLGRMTCLHAHVNTSLSKNTSITARLYFTNQDRIQEWIAGFNFSFNADKTPLFAGLWYRFGRDLIPVAGIDVKGFQLMMSYDVNISRYNIATKAMGGFELSLIKNLACNYQKKNKSGQRKGNYNNCPKF